MLKYHQAPFKWPSVYPTRSVNALRCVLANGLFSNPVLELTELSGEPYLPLSEAMYKAYWVEGQDIRDDEVLVKIMADAGVGSPRAVLEQ